MEGSWSPPCSNEGWFWAAVLPHLDLATVSACRRVCSALRVLADEAVELQASPKTGLFGLQHLQKFRRLHSLDLRYQKRAGAESLQALGELCALRRVSIPLGVPWADQAIAALAGAWEWQGGTPPAAHGKVAATTGPAARLTCLHAGALSEAGLCLLPRFSSLRELSLCSCHVRPEHIEALVAAAPLLGSLSLARCKQLGEGPGLAPLASLKWLRSLHLEELQLTDEGLAMVAALGMRLTSLVLKGASLEQVSPAGLLALQRCRQADKAACCGLDCA
jgi:hypothetical protein